MADRRPGPGAGDPRSEPDQAPAAPPADDAAYTEEEEAEVRKRLEDLGYVE
jgi:hypothetical protein